MDIFSWFPIGVRLLYFIPSMILLIVVPFACVGLYAAIFSKILPYKIYKSLLFPIALLGFFIWAIPMNMGFYEFFRGMF